MVGAGFEPAPSLSVNGLRQWVLSPLPSAKLGHPTSMAGVGFEPTIIPSQVNGYPADLKSAPFGQTRAPCLICG